MLSRRWTVALFVGSLGTLLWLVLNRSYLTADSAWALVWGREIANGELPSFESAFAPRTHPFATALGFLMSPLGEHAETAVFALCALALAAVVWAVFRTGQLAFSWPVGAFAAVAVTTSFPFLSTMTVGSVDVLVVALVLSAAVLELRSQRCGAPVLALLAVAGLQRPEAWLLSGAYWLYLFPALDPWGRIRAGALAVAAPLIWLVSGLVVTGDPLFSFTETLQKDVVAPTGQGGGSVVDSQVLRSVFDVFRAVLRLPVMLGAGLGLALGLATARRRSVVPAGLAIVGTAAVALLALKGIYLSERYALPPAAAFAVFCGFFTFGWIGQERRRVRWAWAAGAGLLIGALLASAPSHVNRLQDLGADNSVQAAVVRNLRALTQGQDTAAIVARCERVVVPNGAPVPYLALLLDRPPDTFQAAAPGGAPAVVLTARDQTTREFLLASGRGRSEQRRVPPGSREIASNSSWRLYRHGC